MEAAKEFGARRSAILTQDESDSVHNEIILTTESMNVNGVCITKKRRQVSDVSSIGRNYSSILKYARIRRDKFEMIRLVL